MGRKKKYCNLFFNYTWNLALFTLRETGFLLDIVLLTILDSEKVRSDGFLKIFLT